MSIDIDGNDYWVWDAINVVEPRVVIIETHVEFGTRSIVVPYDKKFYLPWKSSLSSAMQKFYRLNIYGFNTIYVKESLLKDCYPNILSRKCFRILEFK